MIVSNTSDETATGWGWRGWVVSVVVVSASMVLSRSVMQVGQLSAIWLPNAVTLGILLLVPRRQRYLYLGSLYLTRVATGFASGMSGLGVPVMPLIDALVTLIAVLLLGGERAWIEGAAERVGSWTRFAVGGVLIPSLISGALKVPVGALVGQSDPRWATVWASALVDTATNGLAAFLVVPIILRLRPTYLRGHPVVRRLELVGLLVVLALAAVGVMAQRQPILLFLLPVPLVVLVIRHGIVGAVLGALTVVPVAVGFTFAGVGPFLTVGGGGVGAGLLWAQVFLILLMAADIVAVALLDGQHRSGTRAVGDDGVYRLVAENAGDLLVMLDPDDRIRYASPAAPARLGLDQEDLIEQPWQSRVHPDDRSQVAEALAACRERDSSTTCLARVRHRDGSWRSFDIRMRLVPESSPGSGHPVVAQYRDVTEVTRRQHELERQNLELEEAAGTDPLTGLANRRRLADVRSAEWATAATLRRPLSMLVVDIDHFKAYNDRYGHSGGDAALLAVADAIRAVLRRPSDLGARFGGEEFVILLPRTTADGAHDVAEALCNEVRERRIPHEDSSWGYLTVSVGAACVTPPGRDDDGQLFAAADDALYRAKGQGRNRVEDAVTEDT